MASVIFKENPKQRIDKKKVIRIYRSDRRYKQAFFISLVLNLAVIGYLIAVHFHKLPLL